MAVYAERPTDEQTKSHFQLSACICCHGDKVYLATNNMQTSIGSRSLCTKYELHRPTDSRVMNVRVCCHGNKIYMRTK